jgi:hypothetical protein
MFGLSEKTRWLLFIVGVVLVALWFLEHKELLTDYPFLELLVFPYIWIVGIVLIIVGYGITDESEDVKPTGSGGVDGAPGFNEGKHSNFRDGPFGGDGGGSSGGGD